MIFVHRFTFLVRRFANPVSSTDLTSLIPFQADLTSFVSQYLQFHHLCHR